MYIVYIIILIYNCTSHYIDIKTYYWPGIYRKVQFQAQATCLLGPKEEWKVSHQLLKDRKGCEPYGSDWDLFSPYPSQKERSKMVKAFIWCLQVEFWKSSTYLRCPLI